MAYDVVVVGFTHRNGSRGAAATRAGKKKHEHYNNHKGKCKDKGRLTARRGAHPLALEATGAVGNEVKELGKDLKHAHETRVLPMSSDAWVY